jgi:MFS family permease
MRATSTWTATSSIDDACGPLVGKWLVGYDWRRAFWVNLPLCPMVIMVARRWPAVWLKP